MTTPVSKRSRRAFLRGAGGAALALPFLASLQRAGAEPVAPIKRYVNWLGWFGALPQYWMGEGEGTSFELGAITAPLEPLKSKLGVVSGVNMASIYRQMGRAGNHSLGGSAMLTSAPISSGFWDSPEGWMASGPSIDFVIANRIGTANKHRSLFVGDGTDHLHSILVDEANNPYQANPIWNPHELWQLLFAEFAGDAAELEKTRLGRQSIIDSVLPDYESLAGKLSGGDKKVVDQHLASIREVELALQAVAACAPPGKPKEQWDAFDPTQAKERYQLLFDMVAIALACDLTRVATLSLSARFASPRDLVPDMDSLSPEFPDVDVHGFSHGTWHQPGQTNVWREIQVWRMGMLRDFAMKLDGIAEGEGTSVLDNTVIVHTSEVMTGLHDGMPLQEWGYANPMDNAPARMTGLPIFYLGGAGGALKTGQHFRLDKTHTYADGLGKYSHGELYLTMARAMGIDDASLPTFGDPEVCKNVVEEILT